MQADEQEAEEACPTTIRQAAVGAFAGPQRAGGARLDVGHKRKREDMEETEEDLERAAVEEEEEEEPAEGGETFTSNAWSAETVLPAGWKKVVHSQCALPFYFHAESGVVTWLQPYHYLHSHRLHPSCSCSSSSSSQRETNKDGRADAGGHKEKETEEGMPPVEEHVIPLFPFLPFRRRQPQYRGRLRDRGRGRNRFMPWRVSNEDGEAEDKRMKQEDEEEEAEVVLGKPKDHIPGLEYAVESTAAFLDKMEAQHHQHENNAYSYQQLQVGYGVQTGERATGFCSSTMAAMMMDNQDAAVKPRHMMQEAMSDLANQVTRQGGQRRRGGTHFRGRRKRREEGPTELSPAGKTAVSFLHEYCSNVLKTKPYYDSSVQADPMCPFVTVVRIGDKEYGRGAFINKKQSKQLAAEATLNMLVPGLFNPTGASNQPYKQSEEDLSPLPHPYELSVEDDRVLLLSGKTPAQVLQEHCNRTHAVLEIKSQELEPEFPSLDYRNKKGGRRFMVEATLDNIVCTGEGTKIKEAKQRAAQKILKQLHPNIRTWGEMLDHYDMKLDTNRFPKEEELQRENAEPNMRLLVKLREEMSKRFLPNFDPVYPPDAPTAPTRVLSSTEAVEKLRDDVEQQTIKIQRLKEKRREERERRKEAEEKLQQVTTLYITRKKQQQKQQERNSEITSTRNPPLSSLPSSLHHSSSSSLLSSLSSRASSSSSASSSYSYDQYYYQQHPQQAQQNGMWTAAGLATSQMNGPTTGTGIGGEGLAVGGLMNFFYPPPPQQQIQQPVGFVDPAPSSTASFYPTQLQPQLQQLIAEIQLHASPSASTSSPYDPFYQQHQQLMPSTGPPPFREDYNSQRERDDRYYARDRDRDRYREGDRGSFRSRNRSRSRERSRHRY
ncbi:Microprocessor complex subunit dgcr8 [Balamuthia mandrillaris]